MKTCTFFGHSSCPEDIYENLKQQIIVLIEEKNVRNFLLGSNGDFDLMVLKILKSLQTDFNISYKVVLAYMPHEHGVFIDDENSIFPEELAIVHKKYAIEYRNNFMLHKSDYVIAYITHNFGGAAKFYNKAIRQNKTVFNIAACSSN